MIIFSEKTNKQYATEEECLAAEKEYMEQIKAEKAKEHLRRNELKKVRQEYLDAREKYVNLLREYGDLGENFSVKIF
jgi:hypothetical protein